MFQFNVPVIKNTSVLVYPFHPRSHAMIHIHPAISLLPSPWYHSNIPMKKNPNVVAPSHFIPGFIPLAHLLISLFSTHSSSCCHSNVLLGKNPSAMMFPLHPKSMTVRSVPALAVPQFYLVQTGHHDLKCLFANCICPFPLLK